MLVHTGKTALLTKTYLTFLLFTTVQLGCIAASTSMYEGIKCRVSVYPSILFCRRWLFHEMKKLQKEVFDFLQIFSTYLEPQKCVCWHWVAGFKLATLTFPFLETNCRCLFSEVCQCTLESFLLCNSNSRNCIVAQNPHPDIQICYLFPQIDIRCLACNDQIIVAYMKPRIQLFPPSSRLLFNQGRTCMNPKRFKKNRKCLD